MIDEVVVFAQVSVIVVTLAASLCAIGVITTRAIRWATRNDRPAVPSDQRLEQLQQSVDAIAIEVERIAEVQRFTATLLAERTGSEPSLPERAGRG